MTTKTLDFYNIERKIFWMLLTAICATLVFGLYSFSSLTFAVLERKNINNMTQELAVSSGKLEAEYFSKIGGITMEYAKSIGFEEANTKFANEFSSVKLSIAR